MKLNKADFSKYVADKYQMNRKDTHDWVTAIFDTLSEVLLDGNDVNIQNFGRFRFKQRAPKRMVQPATGEEIQIPPHNSITFTSSVNMRRDAKNIPVKCEETNENEE